MLGCALNPKRQRFTQQVYGWQTNNSSYLEKTIVECTNQFQHLNQNRNHLNFATFHLPVLTGSRISRGGRPIPISIPCESLDPLLRSIVTGNVGSPTRDGVVEESPSVSTGSAADVDVGPDVAPPAGSPEDAKIPRPVRILERREAGGTDAAPCAAMAHGSCKTNT